MSAILDPNPIPRYAVQAWLSEAHLFIAIPVKGQAPFIDKFPNTPAGLHEALVKMRNYHTHKAAPPIYTPPPRPETFKPKLGPLSNDRRLALAQDILAKLLITPKR